MCSDGTDAPTVEDFARFVKETLGVDLAPWQIELARRLFPETGTTVGPVRGRRAP